MDLTFCFAKYTVNVVSTAAFGLESGAFEQEKSMFEKMAENLQFNMRLKNILKFITILLAPRVAIFLRLRLFDLEAYTFFSKTIKNRNFFTLMFGSKCWAIEV